MKRLSKFFLLGVTIALLFALVIPIAAQDEYAEPSGPGEGGVIIESNPGGDDPATFNPIYGSDTTSSSIYGKMYPGLIGLDDETFSATPGAPDGLAASWEYDETGTVLTVHLREDIFWSDGTPITADDYLYAFNAVKSGQTSSPRLNMYELDDGTVVEGPIHEVTKIDDYTLQFRLGTVVRDENGEVVLDENGNPELVASCDAINEIGDVGVVPAHVFEAAFGDDYAAMEADPYFFPSTDSGPATFGAFTEPYVQFGVAVSLLADQNYADTAVYDFVSPGEWVLQSVADSNVAYERFLAGDFAIQSISANNQNSFRALADETGDFQYIEYPGNGYTYIGLNLADPANPQSGRDADGNLIDQGLHPVFGDVRVRQAIAHGINVEEIIGTKPDGDNPATGILEGNGYPIAVHDHAVYSQTKDILAENGVAPRAYDPELAASLLEEAGWVDTDGDGVRECQGCLYATEIDPSFEGSELTFELNANIGNVLREAIGETVRAQLAEIGVVVDFQLLEWGTVLDRFDAQDFDAIIIGWRLGLPWQPSGTTKAFFSIGNDIVPGGFNYVSYHNPEFDAILEEAGSLAGCDPDERNQLYAETQIALYNDMPYIPLYFTNTMVAAQGGIENFDPIPYNTTWNYDDWIINSQD